jgi:hypothetical protein
LDTGGIRPPDNILFIPDIFNSNVSTMEELIFFGVSVSTLADLAVAFATFGLVVFTYLSVKTSEKQITILQKEKERPIIIEFIKRELNFILIDSNNELRFIDGNIITIRKNYPMKDNIFATLVFPIPKQKPVYKNFGKDLLPWFLRSDKSLVIQVEKIAICLQKRVEIYKLIESNLDIITEEYLTSIFPKIIKSTFYFNEFDGYPEFFSFDPVVNPQNGKTIYVIRTILPTVDGKTISEEKLKEDLASMIAISLFPNNQNNTFPDYRLSLFLPDYPFQPVMNKVNDFICESKSELILGAMHSINDELKELHKLDTTIDDETSNILKKFKEIYWFTEHEISI